MSGNQWFSCLDPPSEVLIPSEESTVEINDSTTIEPIRTTILETTTTTTIISTLTTVTTTTTTASSTTITTTTTSPSPTTSMLPLKQAQIHNERPSTVKMLNHTSRTRNSSTQHWFPLYHPTTTEQIPINYSDGSKLDLCDGFYDAITMYKGTLFIFKGQVRNNSISNDEYSFLLVFLAIWSTWFRSSLAYD